VLQDVLGLLVVAEHVPAEREQPAMVAVVDRLECPLVAHTNARHQSIVPKCPQQPPR
jgi:hypothetical protein